MCLYTHFSLPMLTPGTPLRKLMFGKTRFGAFDYIMTILYKNVDIELRERKKIIKIVEEEE